MKTNDEFKEEKSLKKSYYWDDTVDGYIVKYIQETDTKKKSVIFERHLYKPISKLIDSIVHRYKLHNFEHDGLDDIRQQCMVFLIETVLPHPMFDPSRQKSYSYIGTSVRRYLIQKIRKHADKTSKHISIDVDLSEYYGDGNEDTKSFDNTILNSINYSYNNIEVENLSKELLDKFLDFLREEVQLLSPINEKSTKNWVSFLNSFILICETNHGISFIENKIIFYNALKKINEFTTAKNYTYMNILKDRYKSFVQQYLTNNK